MPDSCALNVACTPNASVAYNYFIGKGLRDYQAAAVVGNLQQESFPEINTRLEVLEKKNQKMSRGIAMWQPTRWQNLLTFAGTRDPWALGTQLDFLWYELESSSMLAALQASPSLEDAVLMFQNQFERPDPVWAATDRRICYARNALQFCALVTPPEPASKRGGVVVATVGVLAFVTAAGYGAYKLLSRTPRPIPRRLPPEPEPEPVYYPPPNPMRRF